MSDVFKTDEPFDGELAVPLVRRYSNILPPPPAGDSVVPSVAVFVPTGCELVDEGFDDEPTRVMPKGYHKEVLKRAREAERKSTLRCPASQPVKSRPIEVTVMDTTKPLQLASGG